MHSLLVSESSSYDLLVAGAGIAGLSVAHAALQAGLKTAVVDPSPPGRGASGVPMALLNPATGRKALKTWRAEDCMSQTRALLETVQEYSGETLFINNGIARPAFNSKIAADMIHSHQQGRWPEEWVEWLDEPEFIRRFPSLYCHGGGLWIPVGCTVDMPRFLHSLYRYLEERGAAFHFGATCQINPAHRGGHSRYGRVVLSSGVSLMAGCVVQATGPSLARDPIWEFLPLHPVKGQALLATLKQPLSFSSSVSGLGYIAQAGYRRGEIMLGSTYEHNFLHEEPDQQGAEYLLNRLDNLLPGLSGNLLRKEGWAGVRMTTPNRKPVVGAHPEMKHLYIFGGLGSKGLTLAPYLGQQLVDLITKGSELPAEVNTDRFAAI